MRLHKQHSQCYAGICAALMLLATAGNNRLLFM
jgi:hypothetical protein